MSHDVVTKNYRSAMRQIVGDARNALREMLFRAISMFSAGFVLSYTYENILFLVWGVGFVTLEVTMYLHARLRFDQLQISYAQITALLTHYAMIAVYYAGLPVWLLTLGRPELEYGAVMLVCGFGLHAVLNHSATTQVLMIHSVIVTILTFVVAAQWSQKVDNWQLFVLIFTFASFTALYFNYTLFTLKARSNVARQDRAALAHAQKMEAVGRLSSGISHDFNNLLTVIAGNMDLIRESENEAERGMLHREARDAVDRGAGLVRQLLATSRKSNLEMSEVRAAAFLRDFESLAARVLPANLNLAQTLLPDETVTLLTDRSQLEAALLNLVINARDAMEPLGGQLTISAGTVQLTVHHTEVSRGQLRAGKYLSIEVIDTGHGIPKDMIEKITDPYVTTKPAGKGSGLGLAMVKGFAEQSGGALVINSDLGRGTVMRLFLPL